MQIISNLEWKSFYEFETSFSLPRSVNYFPIPVFLFFFSCQIFDTFFSFFYLFRVTHFSLFVHLCFPAISFFFFYGSRSFIKAAISISFDLRLRLSSYFRRNVICSRCFFDIPRSGLPDLPRSWISSGKSRQRRREKT